jgi:hypothetical protein
MFARALSVARRERVLVLLAAAYILFRLVGFLAAEPRGFNDTVEYEHTAGQTILSRDFLAGGRPPTLPLVYKLVTGDDARIWAQLLISITCWLALAGAVATTIRTRALRPLTFSAVLVFALAPEIVLWDATLLSESVSLSLTAALVAAWLWILRRPSPSAYGAMLALAAAWVFARDPHSYVVAGLALTLALSIAVSSTGGGSRRLRAIAAVALATIAATSIVAATQLYARWAFPLQNVLAIRISAEPDQLSYFEDAGMPVTTTLLAAMRVQRETGENVLAYPPSDDSPEELRDATPFQRWLLTEGRSTYTRFLLAHPGVVAGGFGHLDQVLLDPELSDYASGASPWSGGTAAAVVYPRQTGIVIAWLPVAMGLAAFVWLRFGPRREWLVPAFLIVTSLPFAIFVFHAGAVEPDRHGLLPSVFLRLGALLLVLFAVDRWLQARHEADRKSSGTQRPRAGRYPDSKAGSQGEVGATGLEPVTSSLSSWRSPN